MALQAFTVTDDDGSGTTGTVGDNAWLQTLLSLINARWSEITTTSTGSQNNLSITSGGIEADVLRCNNATDLTITGIAKPASPAKAGKSLIIYSVGAGNVFLVHQSGSSSAGNKLTNLATSGNTPLAAGSGVAVYVYDETADVWRLVYHDQGAWLVPTHADSDYTGGAGSDADWVVAGGDVGTCAYRLNGRTLHVAFEISTTTIANTPLPVKRTIPGGFTATRTARNLINTVNNGGTAAAGVVAVGAATTALNFYRSVDTTLAWVNGTDNNSVFGTIAFEVS